VFVAGPKELADERNDCTEVADAGAIRLTRRDPTDRHEHHFGTLRGEPAPESARLTQSQPQQTPAGGSAVAAESAQPDVAAPQVAAPEMTGARMAGFFFAVFAFGQVTAVAGILSGDIGACVAGSAFAIGGMAIALASLAGQLREHRRLIARLATLNTSLRNGEDLHDTAVARRRPA
jgi:hypothetical protein